MHIILYVTQQIRRIAWMHDGPHFQADANPQICPDSVWQICPTRQDSDRQDRQDRQIDGKSKPNTNLQICPIWNLRKLQTMVQNCNKIPIRQRQIAPTSKTTQFNSYDPTIATSWSIANLHDKTSPTRLPHRLHPPPAILVTLLLTYIVSALLDVVRWLVSLALHCLS